ncbi:hypothetical protein TUMSATVNIG1_58140 (plasmid) [Vibrio nigripulchritudo]|nr:hypothetical protein VNTUMSATTG_57650 [Vibrio nigripulchritudo]BDU35205.1 hypothetical protein TUMSATVNIG1_58140 [Vibrio nigripulchritudo]
MSQDDYVTLVRRVMFTKKSCEKIPNLLGIEALEKAGKKSRRTQGINYFSL